MMTALPLDHMPTVTPVLISPKSPFYPSMLCSSSQTQILTARAPISLLLHCPIHLLSTDAPTLTLVEASQTKSS